MRPYIPNGNPFCFESLSWKHRNARLSTDEYLDCLLDHLLGAQHPEDAHPHHVYDSFCAAIQSCIFEPDFVLLDDTSPLKSLLLNCLNGDLDKVKQHTSSVLASLKPNGISDNILTAMICVACDQRNMEFLDYCFSLIDDPAALMDKMERAIWIAGVEKPDPRIWIKLLDHGWLSRSQISTRSLSELAHHVLLQDPPRIELMEILFNRGFVVSEDFFNEAACTDPDTMRYLVSKFDASKMNDSRALLAAAGSNNAQVVKILLDNGMDVNWMESDNSMRWKDPREPDVTVYMTALHCAAKAGKKDNVELLLQRGANKDTEDSWGRTPVELALKAKHLEIAELIQNYGS